MIIDQAPSLKQTETEQWIKELDGIFTKIKTSKVNNRERALAITKIQEAKQWLGEDFKTA